MKLLKITTEKAFSTEDEAQKEIATNIDKACQEGYTIASSLSTHKVKKAKGEIIDEQWVTKIIEEHESLWD